MTTALALLDAIRAHLAAFELPGLCSVHASIHESTIDVQLRHHHTPQLAADLLAWADTLTDPTAKVWRVTDGASIHLSITGQLTDGVSIHVYAGAPHTTHGPGGDLPPAATAPVSLATLRHLATPGQVTL
jgi:hypothetical protein